MNAPLIELEEYFLFKTEQGLYKKGLAGKPEYEARLKYEIKVILSKGFAGYFLIVQDFVNWAKNNDIYISPGRGSAAGSLVSYVLGITSLDPIKWDLLFERFLNPERASYPDVDFDSEKRYRNNVIEYLFEKYGNEYVAHIGTFNMMRAKAAVRAVTKTLGHPYQLGDKLSKLLLPPVHGKPQSLKESLEKIPELYDLSINNGTEEQILKWAAKVEGLISSIGVHASGIVISNQPLKEIVPLFKGKGDEIATQWDMGAIEEVGLIKFDILGLDALTKLHRCVDLIHERHGKIIDINNIPLDDPKTFALLKAGNAVGVFQLEASSGMRDLLVQIRPVQMEDLIALVAIYRPGPMGSDEVQQYLRVRAGTDIPRYLVSELKPVLEKTNGLIIYQEQVMQIARDLTGYTMAEADDLRKAIGKKKAELMAKHELKFKTGWKNNNLDPDKGDQLWEQIVGFASYAFNRSHAASYAFITYQTAWLKAHYPTEFMCAVMISEAGNQEDIIKCITECKQLGIKVLPPNINHSSETFQISNDKTIYFGLAPIKNLGEKPVQLIIEERVKNGLFKSLEDFCQRVDLSIINKLKLESLILSGAFDQFSSTRATLLSMVEKIWEYRENLKSYLSKEKTFQKKLEAFQKREAAIEVAKQNNIPASKRPASFKQPVSPEKPIWPEAIELSELPEFEIQQKEHELLGFYVSSHPLDTIGNQGKNLCTIEDVKEMQAGTFVSLAVVIVNKKEITTSTTKKKMAFFVLEDKGGTIEATAFPNSYDRYKELFLEGVPLKIDGKIEITESDDGRLTRLMINKVSLFNRVFSVPEDNAPQKITQTIPIQKLSNVKLLLEKFKGDFHSIELILESQDGTLFKIPSIKIEDKKHQFLKELSRILNEQ